ncbi:MAG: aldehyde dehydrogenase family protein [Methanobacteriota archaeon]
MTLPIDPVTRGEDGATLRHVEERLGRFANKHTFLRHEEHGRLDEFHARYDEAVDRVRKELGHTFPLVIGGEEVRTRQTFEARSPADRSLLIGRFAVGTRDDARAAIRSAKHGFRSWSRRPWTDRAAIVERAADVFAKHYFDLCAVMSIEAGKSRFEASIDADEAVDFLRFYAMTYREFGGFDMKMGSPVPNEECRSVRKPYGAVAVVCPFNFPVAITTGMTAAALLTGNTAIMKPSGKANLSGWHIFRLLREAGVPGDALHFLTGGTHDVSNELTENPDVDGLVFTGSKDVGLRVIERSAAQGRPRPVIAEMGGKNAIVISDKADLGKAVRGVYRSSFGFSGQKCSACSRVYVHRKLADRFEIDVANMAVATKMGLPWERDVFMGPVIEASKVKLFEEVVAEVKRDGGRVLAGGHVRRDLPGNYVEPTFVTGLAKDHRVFREEFFMPFAAIAPVDSFAEGIEEANKAQYGLTAGCFSEDPKEIDTFFEGVDAGVLYANRAAGGCTAAVVDGQAFGGWKLSGSTGNGAGGRYYLQQFTREQAQTRVR